MMSALAKIITIVALPCLLASAVECQDGSCAQDETALMQMAQKMIDRSSPNADTTADFKPLPQNHTKIDEAMKRKASGSGMPMTRHRINETHHDKHHDEKEKAKEGEHTNKEEHSDSPSKPEAPSNKKAIDQDKDQEQKEQDKMRKDMKSGHKTDDNKKESGVDKEAKKMAKEMKKQAKELGDAIKKAMGEGGGDDKSDHLKPAPGSDDAKSRAVQAAMTEVDLQNLEVAEAAKNEAMAVAANAAAAEDRVAMQLAAQAQKLVDHNRAKQGNAEDRKKLNAAIAEEVSAEIDELSARSKIEKQALRDAVKKVDAAVKAAQVIASDAHQLSDERAE